MFYVVNTATGWKAGPWATVATARKRLAELQESLASHGMDPDLAGIVRE